MAEEKIEKLIVPAWARDRFGLIKMPVSLMSACAAIFGYVACIPSPSLRAFITAASVFSISAGAAALNNFQDRFADGRMERTRVRPLPSGRIRPLQALFLSIILITAGIAGLVMISSSPAAPLAGISAIIFYNAVYTPLKAKTQLSLVPGVICGMMPPLIGWLSAGGDPLSPRIWYILVLFGTWQVPHIWLLLLSRREDFQQAHIPSILDVLSVTQLKRLVCLWVVAFTVLTLFMRLFLIIKGAVPMLLLIGNAVILPAIFVYVLNRPGYITNYRRLFHYLNASTLGIIGIGIIDSGLLSAGIL